MTTPAGSGVTNKGTTYSDGSQVTSTNLNNIVDDAVFNNNAVDDSTIGLNSSTPKALFVKNAGIDTAQLKDNAVTTVKITNLAVTDAKIAEDTITSNKLSFIEDSVSTTAGNILVADGSNYDAEAMSGDATIAAGGALTIANDAVTPAKTSFLGTVDTTADSNSKILSKQSDGEYDSVAPSGDVTMTQAGAFTIANDAINAAKIDDDAVGTAAIADNVALGGNPTTTTQTAGNNSTRIATTEFVTTAVTNSFAPSIVFTSDARNSESQRYFKNLTEIDDPNSLITINGTSEIEFASTGTYMIEAGIGIDDNDTSGSGDTYEIHLVKSNSSTTVISFQGISFQSWGLSKSGTENKHVTFQIPYTVSDTSTDKLAIYAKEVSSASASQWEGFATIKITKIA